MVDEAAASRSTQPTKQSRGPISRKQVEALISRAVAAFGLVFGAQTVPSVIEQLTGSHPAWSSATIPLLYLALVFAFVTSLLQRGVRFANGAGSLVYVAAVVSWPVFIVATPSADAVPWLYYLLTVATSMAAIAFSRALAVCYLLVVPALMAGGRILASSSTSAVEVSLDSVRAIILGGAVLLIVTMLRQASSAVDAAQTAALASYSRAVRQHATEVERAQVDSIVHDGVLTTLLSAARARGPEAKALAATMAANTIGFLLQAATVGPDDGSTLPIGAVSARIVEAARGSGGVFEIRANSIGARAIPAAAADAVVAASVQAIVNSVQHAPAATARWVSVRGLRPLGVEVRIGDDGPGFDPAGIPRERLGLRLSILERVANAGGVATVASQAGTGTVVTIRWPGDVQ